MNQQQSASTDIAIIGIACRFPGANDHNQFWQNLEFGVNSISEVPSQRWEVEKYYSATPEQPNKSISKWGGLIEDADRFDAHFFGISPREATNLDPQQRIMLELSWSCIEDAGYSPSQLSGSNVGVFIGACNYDSILLMNKSEEDIEGHSGTGTWTCMIPNRISSYFNFHGPSIPIDTACSSSLVAIHYAVNSLKESECETALVGGISVLFTSTTYIQMSQLGMLSPTGQCKTFDSSADGYVRGEGAGVILLKPLEKAIEDSDRIYGVIKGSAINHGGKARTLTSPNVYAQAQVLRSTYTKANIPPNTVSYIEAHGTGTPLGDPIEINALKRGFKQLHQQYGLGKSKKSYCGLGAVKSNIGHLEGASGIAGVIKVLLAMKHKKLPTIVNFKELNPRINLKDSPFYIIDQTQEWKKLKMESGEEIPRRAGVSSFGIGGVNAHIVIEETPLEVRSQKSEVRSDNYRVAPLQEADNLRRSLHLLTLSAKTETALSELVVRYQNYLVAENNDIELADICYTANTGRTHFNHRLAVVASNQQELVEKLSQYKAGAEVAGICSGKLSNNSAPPKIAFLFTGQGSQYVNMGRQLYEESSVFREAINKCDEILGTFGTTSLKEILYPEDINTFNLSILSQTAYTQPALFAIEYALAQLWQFWGIKPDIVIGHSLGEYVAACVAGVFSLEDGLKLIVARGRLMQQLPSGGKMVSVMASESYVREVFAERCVSSIASVPQISIAAINGPESVVISGESVAVSSIVNSLELSGIKTKQLQVSRAFHSPLMEPMLAEFEAVANQITYNNSQIPIISNLTGTTADNSISSAQYWVAHICKPVRFAQGMETLHKQGAEIFLEIGPKPILLGMGRRCLPEDVGVWLPSLRPKKIPLPSEMPENAALLRDEWQQMLSSLGELYVRGTEVDWMEVYKDYTCRKVALPTYPFQRKRYWVKTAIVDSSYDTQIPQFSTGHKSYIQSLVNYLKTTEKFSESELKLFDKIQDVLDDNLVAKVEEELEKSKVASEFIHVLKKTPQKERQNILINHLQNQIVAVLGLPPSELPDPEIGFFEMGMDSLMAVELKKRLEKTLLISLSPTLAFNYPNISALSSYIIEDVLGCNETKNEEIKLTKNNNTLIDYLSQLEKFSESEIESSIIKELTEIETLLK